MTAVRSNIPPASGAVQRMEETPFEAKWRKEAGFDKYEAKLPSRMSMADVSSLGRVAGQIPEAAMSYLLMPIFGLLGDKNPLVRRARDDKNIVWVLDNTAYQPVGKGAGEDKWEYEVVSCYFHKGREDVTRFATAILDAIGADGKVGVDDASTALIESRVRPFVDAVAPARTLPVTVTIDGRSPVAYNLGPSNANGIAAQIFSRDHKNEVADGTRARIVSNPDIADLPLTQATTYFAGPTGIGIISDIDDTIKVTQTPDPAGILRTTFAEEAKTTAGLPEFYKNLQELFKPTWFYLSASPYNLYPFLHQFVHEHYPQGTIILRDASWQNIGGLLGSLTQGTKAYKSSRIEKIHQWLPQRKFICIGDSTQQDPETYAAMYKKFPGWIIAIYIRKVTDAPFMEEKNKPERFEEAFEGVPTNVWRLFEMPSEIEDHVKHIAGEAHKGV